ncbi:MAG: phosphoglycolate phosphatase, partial [Phenylobacterium zucineum]
MLNSEVLKGAVIVFDLDGTLVDTAPDLISTLNHILMEEGMAPLADAAARPLIGQGARRLLQKGFQAQGQVVSEQRLDDLLDRFIDHYSDHSSDRSRPFPGVIDALTTLKTAGARLCVCTNKLTRLSVPILNALGLSPSSTA